MLILFRDEEGLSFLLIGVVSGNLGTDTADCGSSQYPDYFTFIAHHNVSISFRGEFRKKTPDDLKTYVK